MLPVSFSIYSVTAYLSAVFGQHRHNSAYVLHTDEHLSAGDVVLSVTTAYFLLKFKKNCHPSSVGLISALVRLTFETAAPATIWYVQLDHRLYYVFDWPIT